MLQKSKKRLYNHTSSSENADVVVDAVLLVLRYALCDPRDVPDFLDDS
jgi:hypothetical protein